jgi:hypothetical protein
MHRMMDPARLGSVTDELGAEDDFQSFCQAKSLRLAQAAHLLTGNRSEAGDLTQLDQSHAWWRGPAICVITAARCR